MGQDKAAMLLGGHTLLKRAVDTVRGVAALRDGEYPVTVTLVGEREELGGAERAIVDRYPGCGPLGGMEAALADLERDGVADWAFFLPVDMPFLSSRAIEGLLAEWMDAARDGAWVCHVEADGRPQPLVSMIHRAVRPFMDEALTGGRFKVTPVLRSAAGVLASGNRDKIGSGLHTTDAGQDCFATRDVDFSVAGGAEEWTRRRFSNLNNEEEFREAETFIARMGLAL